MALGAIQSDAEQFSKDARGLPGKAISWTQATEGYEAYRAENLRFESLWNKTFHEKIAAVESLFGDKTVHITARQNLHNVLSQWELLVRDQLVAREKRADSTILFTLIETIEHAKKFIQKNVHPRLLVEQVLLAIP